MIAVSETNFFFLFGLFIGEFIGVSQGGTKIPHSRPFAMEIYDVH